MTRNWMHRAGLSLAALCGLIGVLLTQAGATGTPQHVAQGAKWTAAAQSDFYTRYQGAQIMPLAWIKALKQANGAPFLADSLQRYGYLPNPKSPYGLPVGFTAGGQKGAEAFGMTCAACHTRQIEVAKTEYRIDGGPAIVDMHSLLLDIDTAVATILHDDKAFQAFAQAVLGLHATPGAIDKLHEAVAAWFLRYDTLIQKGVPSQTWGIARLDAVGMIFDRLTGLDIGDAPSYLIADNIQQADAPVRYPFLWNAPIQDKTQWPGFADNGNDLLGLARNLGEVYGVFAIFHPQKASNLLGIDYLGINTADFHGLGALEDLIKKIGPPKWPWKLDAALVKEGKEVFDRDNAQGGCVGCHGIRRGAFRSLTHETWATPIQDVGTDSREYDVLGWTVDTGVLNGARIPLLASPLQPKDKAFNVLSTAVLGSILQDYFGRKPEEEKRVKSLLQAKSAENAAISISPEVDALKGAFRTPGSGAEKLTATAAEAPTYAYESRVLEGIWAAAPYLHNGSVPTLAELLKPAAERVAAFPVGPAYDIDNVGLAAEQTRFDYTYKTTDCSQRNSGNSRCGHEFGTQLSDADKHALLEYLKSL